MWEHATRRSPRVVSRWYMYFARSSKLETTGSLIYSPLFMTEFDGESPVVAFVGFFVTKHGWQQLLVLKSLVTTITEVTATSNNENSWESVLLGNQNHGLI